MRRRIKDKALAWLLIAALTTGSMPMTALAASDEEQAVMQQLEAEGEDGEQTSNTLDSEPSETTDLGEAGESPEEVGRDAVDFTDKAEELQITLDETKPEETKTEELKYYIQFLKEGEELQVQENDTFRVEIPKDRFIAENVSEPVPLYNCEKDNYESQTEVQVAEYTVEDNVVYFKLHKNVEAQEYVQAVLSIAVKETQETEIQELAAETFLEKVLYENGTQEVSAEESVMNLSGLSEAQMEQMEFQYRIQFAAQGQEIREGAVYSFEIPKTYFAAEDTKEPLLAYEEADAAAETAVPVAEYEIADNTVFFTVHAVPEAGEAGVKAIVRIPVSVKSEALTEQEQTIAAENDRKTTVILPAKPSDEEEEENQTEDTDKDVNKDTNKDTDQDTNKDTNKDTDQDTNKDTNKDTDQDTNKDTNKDTDQDTNQDTNKDTNQDTTEDTDENITEDIQGDTDQNSDNPQEEEESAETGSETENTAETENQTTMFQRGRQKIANFFKQFRLSDNEPKESVTYTTTTKHTFSGEDVPEGFQFVTIEVKSKEGGYSSEKENNVVGLSYQVVLDDGYLYDLSEKMSHETGFPIQGFDEDKFLKDVQDWFAKEENQDMLEKYSIQYQYSLGEYFTGFSNDSQSVMLGEFEIARYEVKNGMLLVDVLPICCFMDSVQFKFGVEAKVDKDKLKGDSQEAVIDDEGRLIFQSLGSADGGGGKPEEPKYTIEKTAPSYVNGTEITYEISVEAKAKEVLNGKMVEDIAPEGLEVQRAFITLNPDAEGAEEEDIAQGNLGKTFSYTFAALENDAETGKPSNEIKSAKFKLVMGLTTDEYNKFISANGINKDFKNKALLKGEEGNPPLAESEEVPTHMSAQFIGKKGKTENLEGSRWLWTINVNTQLPSLDYGYLVDTLCWTDHVYDFEAGIHVKAGADSFTITDVKEIADVSGDMSWEKLTAEKLNELVNKAGFDTGAGLDKNNPQAFYYKLPTTEKNPFSDREGEPDFKEQAILIIPYKNLQGTAGESKKVTIKYSTDLNMHGLSAKEYWNKINEDKDNEPNIDNVVKLLWKNKDGNGPVPPEDWIDIGKEPQVHPGSIAKTGLEYNEKTQALTWGIDVNKIGLSMEDVVLTDFIPNGAYKLTDGSDFEDTLNIQWEQYEMKTSKLIEKGTLGKTADKLGRNYSVTEDEKDGKQGKEITISLGNTFDEKGEPFFYKLKFTLKLTDKVLATQSKDQSMSNKVALRYKEDDKPVDTETEGTINVPNTLIEKVSDGAYDYRTHELPWKVTINPNSLPIDGAKITDILEKDFEFGNVTKVEYKGKVRSGEDATADLATLQVQMKEPNFNKKEPVFEIGKIDAPYTVYFTTIATETWRSTELKELAPQGTIKVPNTAQLDGKIYGNAITGATDSASNVVKKTLIGKSGKYNEGEGTIDWVIDVNKEQYNIAGMYLEETLTDTKGKNPVHELDPDSVKIYTITYDKDKEEIKTEVPVDYENDFTKIGADGFKYTFEGDEGDENCQMYRVKFTTYLTGSALDAKINNKVYLKESENKTDNESGFSNGGYDGSFDISTSSTANKRPRIVFSKVSSNTDDIEEGKKLPLKDVHFWLSTHTFTYDGKSRTLTIGPEVERYAKESFSEATGAIAFNNIKVSQGINGSKDNDLVCVLEEKASVEGYEKPSESTYYVVYFSGSDLGESKITGEVNQIILDGKTIDKEYFSRNNDGNTTVKLEPITNEPKPLSFSFTKKEVALESYKDNGSGQAGATVAADVKFRIDPIEPPKGSGLPNLVGKVDSQEVESDENGVVAMPNLDAGAYRLTEIRANAGQKKGQVDFTVRWNETKLEYEVSFLADTAKNMQINLNGNTPEFTDDINTTDISFTKKVGYEDGAGNQIVNSNEEPLADVTFELRSVKTDGNVAGVGEGNVVKTVTSTTDAKGNVRFENIPVGTYEIYELYKNKDEQDISVKGYDVPEDNVGNKLKEEKVYGLVVEENNQEGDAQNKLTAILTAARTNNPSSVKPDTGNEKGNPTIYNKPIKGSIQFTKKISANNLPAFKDDILEGAEFGLYRKIGNNEAKEPIATATSGEDGAVTFEDIEYGDYVLRESKAPTGYQKSEDVQISKAMLSIEIDLGKNSFDYEHSDDITNTLIQKDVDFIKKDKDGNVLDGIEFDVYRRGDAVVNEDGSTGTDPNKKRMKIDVADDVTTYYRYNPAGENGVLTTKDGGKFGLSNVPIGDYVLVEKTSVDTIQDDYGDKVIYISISKDGNVTRYEREWDLSPDAQPDTPIDCITISANETPMKDPKNWQSVDEEGVIYNYKKYGFVNLNKIAAEQMYDESGDKLELVSEDAKPVAGAKFDIYKQTGEGQKGELYLTLQTNDKGQFAYNSETLSDGKTDEYYVDASDSNVKKHLWYGSYILQEIEAPDGYQVNGAEIPFVLNEVNCGHRGTAWISLSGDGENESVKYVRADKSAENTETLDETPNKDESAFVDVVKRGSITLKKVSSENGGALLSGAAFDVKQSDGKVVAHLTETDSTADKGIYSLTDLTSEEKANATKYAVNNKNDVPYLYNAGTEDAPRWMLLVDSQGDTSSYQIVETRFPTGYQKEGNSEESVMVEAGKLDKEKAIKNAPLPIMIQKTDDAGNSLTGAKFQIKGTFVGGSTSVEVAAGEAIEGLLADTEYTVSEIQTPEGYRKPSQSLKFTVNEARKVSFATASKENDLQKLASLEINKRTISIKNKPIILEIEKNFEGKEPENFDGTTEFTLAEMDASGNAGTSVKLTTDKEGKLTVKGKVSDGKGNSIYLTGGKRYQLKETKAAAGYVTPTDDKRVILNVVEDGTITIVEDTLNVNISTATDEKDDLYLSNTLTLSNEQTAVMVQKTNGDGKPITGGEFAIYEKQDDGSYEDAEPIVTWKNQNEAANPYVITGLLAEGTDYVLRETSRPDGYLLADDIPFRLENGELEELGNVVTVENEKILRMKDEKVLKSIELDKTYEDTQEPISNVVFDLIPLNADGEELESKAVTKMTDENGHLIFEDVTEGKYHIREKLAKSEAANVADDVYINPEDVIEVEVTVNDTEKQIVLKDEDGNEIGDAISVENERFSAGVTLTKQDPEDGTKLEGVIFTLEKESADGEYEPYSVDEDQTTGEYKTDENGVPEVMGLEKGKYRLTETNPVYGYVGHVDAGDASNPEKVFVAEFTLKNEHQGNTVTIPVKENAAENWNLNVTTGSELLKKGVLTNQRATGSVTIQKVDGEDGAGLDGTVFELHKKKDGNWLEDVWSFITGNQYESIEDMTGEELTEAGELTIRGLEWGTYKLVEKKALDGYKKTTAEFIFTIGRTEGQDWTLKVDGKKIENFPNELTIEKWGSDLSAENKLLAGATFEITRLDSKGESTEDKQTVDMTEKGGITLKRKLVGGETYRLREVTEPEGYCLAEDVVFTMGEDGQAYLGKEVAEGAKINDNKIVVTDVPTKFGITKIDAETENELKGAEFKLGGEFADDTQEKIVKPEDGSLSGLLIVGKSYTLTETKVPDGYEKYEKEIAFSVNGDGTLELETKDDNTVRLGEDGMSLVISNQAMGIRIFKKCGEDAVEGITAFNLYREENQQKVFQKKVQTGKNGQFALTEKDLVAGQTYYLEEINAAAGYVTPRENANTVKFQMQEDGTIELLPMENGLEAKVVDLDAGDGKATGLEIQNVKTVVKVQKTDVDGNLITGGEFAIYEKQDDGSYEDAEPIVTWKNQNEAANPYVITGLLAEGTDYVLRETSRPDGYLLADDIAFRLEHGELVESKNVVTVGNEKILRMKDEKVLKSIELDKTYEDTQEPISNVVFDLIPLNADGEELESKAVTKMTDENGHLIFEDVTEGKYHIREKLAKSEAANVADDVYINPEDVIEVEVTVNDTEKQIVLKDEDGNEIGDAISVENERFSAGVTLTKQDPEDGTKLEGVIFTLEKESADGEYEPYSVDEDQTTGEYKTDENGVLEVMGLEKGKYRLTETNPVYGYVGHVDAGDASNPEKVFVAEFTLKNEHQGNTVTIPVKENAAENWNLNVTTGSELLKKGVLTNQRATGSVTIQKVDGEDGAGLDGTVFELHKKKDGNWLEDVWSFITGNQYESIEDMTGEELTEAGELTIRGLEWGTYKLVEKKALDGYKKTTAEFIFTIGRTEGQDWTLKVDGKKIENFPNELTIEKWGSDLSAENKLLAGATFEITRLDSKGESTEDKQTVDMTEKGGITLKRKLVGGETYRLREVTEPEGYCLAEDVVFTMGEDGQAYLGKEVADGAKIVDNKIIVTDVPTKFGITKIDVETQEELEGAEFKLVGVFADGTQEKTVKPEDGSLSGLLLVGERYTLTEAKAPDGYEMYEKEIAFSVNGDGTLELETKDDNTVRLGEDGMSLVISNQAMEIRIFKKCKDEAVKGITTFKLYREENQQKVFQKGVQTEATNGEFALTEEDLVVRQTYYLEETNAAAGYVTPRENANTVKFQMQEDGTIELLPMENGLEAKVVDLDEEDGKAKGLEIQNVKTVVKVQKTDVDGNLITGGEFAIYEKQDDNSYEDAEPIVTWKNQNEAANPYVITGLLAEGTDYVLRETSRPDDYLLADDIPFRLEHGELVESENVVTVENEKILRMTDEKVLRDITLRKTYTGTETLLEGVAFELLGADQKVWGEGVTGKDGTLTFEDIPEGVYTLKENLEKSTPSDVYIKEDFKAKVEVTVSEDETDVALKYEDKVVTREDGVDFTVENDPFKAKVQLTKLDPEDGTPLAGVLFLLERNNKAYGTQKADGGEAALQEGYYYMDKDGALNLEIHDKGSYRLTEVASIHGYQPDSSETFRPFVAEFEVANDKQNQTLEIVQENKQNQKQYEDWKLKIAEGKELLNAKGLTNARMDGTVTLQKVNEKGEGLDKTIFRLYKKQDGNWMEKIWDFITGKRYELVEGAEEISGKDVEEQGRLTIGGLKWGDYKLVEETPSVGHKLAENCTFEFSIGRSGTEILLDVDLDKIVNHPNEITVVKTNFAGEGLKGAEFSITNVENAEDTHKVVTGENGEAVLPRALSGGQTYVLHETKAPEGYRLNPDTEDLVFTMEKDGQLTMDGKAVIGNKMTVKDKPTYVEFWKVGKFHESCSAYAEETVPLANVEFKLYRENEPENAVTAVSDEAGKVRFEGISVGEYVMEETKTVQGYRLDTQKYQVKVTDAPDNAKENPWEIRDAEGNRLDVPDEDGKPQATLINDVYRTNIRFTKVNEQKPDEVLPNSEYGLFKPRAARGIARNISIDGIDENLELIATAVTDENGILEFKGVLMNTDYVIYELKAPDGSYVSEKPMRISFRVNENNEVEIGEFEDGDGTSKLDEITGEIVWFEPSVEILFQKTDLAGNPLAGAKLQIQDKDGEVVEEWVSTEEPYLSHRNLVIGETYKLVEIEAPAGYLLAEPLEFTVDDEKVGPDENKVISYEMQDAHTKVNILKVSEEDREALEGAVFTVEGEFADGTTAKEVQPNKEGATLEKLFAAGKEYKLTETKAPQGYEKLEKSVTFTISEQGEPELKDTEGKENPISVQAFEDGYRIIVADKKAAIPPSGPDEEDEKNPPSESDKEDGKNPPNESDKEDGENPPSESDKEDGKNPPSESDKEDGKNPPSKSDEEDGKNPPSEPDKDDGGEKPSSEPDKDDGGKPSQPAAPVDKDVPKVQEEVLKRQVKTGDEAPIFFYGTILFVSAAVCGILGRRRRKQK